MENKFVRRCLVQTVFFGLYQSRIRLVTKDITKVEVADEDLWLQGVRSCILSFVSVEVTVRTQETIFMFDMKWNVLISLHRIFIFNILD